MPRNSHVESSQRGLPRWVEESGVDTLDSARKTWAVKQQEAFNKTN